MQVKVRGEYVREIKEEDDLIFNYEELKHADAVIYKLIECGDLDKLQKVLLGAKYVY